MHEKFKSAAPYGARKSNADLPAEAVDVDVEFTDFEPGDSHHPVTPRLRITNRAGTALPGGTEFRFGYATSAPGNASDQSGFGTEVVAGGHTGDDVGGAAVEPGHCAEPAWDASVAYGGGSVVSHGGRARKARWWTKGEEPGATGERGVRRDRGAC
ncbi:hypothetical protein GCM10019016_093110 [Streptomyces prasinosporus]|uniref:Chitin-binding type-3 domain-containing protein n=1 Tax=Streptomyces prasinosporus TaxID=68256 RepID=A0ABP6U3H0_9ACTN